MVCNMVIWSMDTLYNDYDNITNILIATHASINSLECV